jgi:rhodanese-related sulfurtransferase
MNAGYPIEPEIKHKDLNVYQNKNGWRYSVSVCLLNACQAGNKSAFSRNEGAPIGWFPCRTAKMLENKDFTMVNVHTPWEGNIPQTDLRLAYDQIEQSLDQLPAEKDAKTVVYCLTSGMAKKAVASLLSQGYTNIWMLDGGTTAWEESGLIINK